MAIENSDLACGMPDSKALAPFKTPINLMSGRQPRHSRRQEREQGEENPACRHCGTETASAACLAWKEPTCIGAKGHSTAIAIRVREARRVF